MNAMNTGHKGCMGTVHANSPEDAIVRLEGLIMSGESKMSEKAVRYQLSSAVNIIVQISRFSDGSRRIQTISEVIGLDSQGNYQLHAIYDIGNLIRGNDGKLQGEIKPTGVLPTFIDEIEANKLPFPRNKFQAA
jgi:pilus assembly protein CpaF